MKKNASIPLKSIFTKIGRRKNTDCRRTSCYTFRLDKGCKISLIHRSLFAVLCITPFLQKFQMSHLIQLWIDIFNESNILIILDQIVRVVFLAIFRDNLEWKVLDEEGSYIFRALLPTKDTDKTFRLQHWLAGFLVVIDSENSGECDQQLVTTTNSESRRHFECEHLLRTLKTFKPVLNYSRIVNNMFKKSCKSCSVFSSSRPCLWRCFNLAGLVRNFSRIQNVLLIDLSFHSLSLRRNRKLKKIGSPFFSGFGHNIRI